MPASITTPAPSQSIRIAKIVALGAVMLVALGFVSKYVFHYYLNYNPAAFDYFWPKRGWLMLHITGGMVALLTGPWQFSQRMRRRYLALHRLMGRIYLIAIACGAVGSFYLAATTPGGWAWGTAMAGLALAWVTTSGMAFYAIRQRQIQVHKEWMVRSYVVTFAFVTFRLLNDLGPTSHLQPALDRAITMAWASWTIPLLFTEVILQLKRLRAQARARA